MRQNLIFNSLLNASTYSYMGVFNFDGSSYILIRPGGTTDIMGNKTIQWKMWLDKESGYYYNTLFCFWPTLSNTDICLAYLDSSSIIITTRQPTPPSIRYSLNGKSNKILTCELKKTSNTIVYFKINEIEEPSVGVGTVYGAVNVWYISDNTLSLDDATIWDIKVINSDASTLSDEFLGYPHGDTSTAWFRFSSPGGGGDTIIYNPNNAGIRNII